MAARGRDGARYCARLHEAAIRAMENRGSDNGVAKEIGCSPTSIANWRVRYPDFSDDLDAAYDRYIDAVAEKGVSALHKHLDEYLDQAEEEVTTRTVRQEHNPKTGAIETLTTSTTVVQRVRANPTLVKTALTKRDPSWTHPKQEVEHSGAVTVEQAVADAAARLEADDGG